MTELEKEVLSVIHKQKGFNLEYKAVLPPARAVGQMICGFANSEGGLIILGVSDSTGKPIITGLSEDFHAGAIYKRAIELLTPTPVTHSQTVYFKDKRLYAIKVEKSSDVVSIEGRVFQRQDYRLIEINPPIKQLTAKDYVGLKKLSDDLLGLKNACTNSMSKFIDHYLSVLNICADLRDILYPASPNAATTNPEGKILMRILFSSCADNFESYLSDLLYEIYLSKPDTLKSKQQVSVKEVLDCADIQEFIVFYAKRKLSKLQRGSVKGFISDNEQVRQLNAISEIEQEEIEKILQIRHLYAHRNGIVDEKFLQFFPTKFKLNSEHQLSLDDMIFNVKYLADTVNRIDKAAIAKYSLNTS
jgi:hypothetical protein